MATATPPLNSPAQRYDYYVKLYNEARAANNAPEAIKWAKFAVREASEFLHTTGGTPAIRGAMRDGIVSLTDFLAASGGSAPAPAAAGGGSANPSEDKIHSTEWFSDPATGLSLENIAGLQNLKDEFILNVFAPTMPGFSDIYTRYRGEQRGLQVLLYGPPGTGKTHAVKCLAGQMGCKIAVVKISDVMANLVGDGAKIIEEIFAQARQYDKSIIFFDEIDAIASSREGDDSRHTKEQLTTLLTNMDGFTSKAEPGQIRVVIAATNRPWALDSAIKRGGRFDTQIYVPMPDPEARHKLIETFLANVPRAEDVTTEWLIGRTDGYAAADIMSICRQATSKPMKREVLSYARGAHTPDCVTREDFESIFANYINPTNDEALMEFDAYRQNMDYGPEYIKFKCQQILTRLSERRDGTRIGGIASYELSWLLKQCRSGALAFTFGYDCDYMMSIDAWMQDKDYDDTFIKERCRATLIALYGRAHIPDYEREWFVRLYQSGYVAEQFATEYDLSFIPSRLQ